MAKFKLKDFVTDPDVKKLEGLTRLDWISLARYYEVDICDSDRKADIMVRVNDYLICNDIITSEESADLISKVKESSSSSSSSESNSDEEGAKAKKKVRKKDLRKLSSEQLRTHLELKKLELENRVRELELENRARELEAESRARELEAENTARELQREQLAAENRARELEAENRTRELEAENKAKELEIRRLELLGGNGDRNKFKVDSAVRSVPVFVETEVDSFFLQFEKVATQREWPVEYWGTLVQTSFKGKAREVYAAMSVDESNDYEKVKSEVLKAYEWVPERYREKFRTWKKSPSQTHMAFCREQKLWFERWINGRKVSKDYDKLEELILLEQFRVSVHSSIKMFLDERDIDTVEEAAKLADNYALTHRIYNYKSKGEYKVDSKRQVSDKYFYHKGMENHSSKYQSQETPKPAIGQSKFISHKDRDNYYKDFACYRCGKIGHISRNCTASFPERINQMVSKEKKKVSDEKKENSVLLLQNTPCSMVPERSDSLILGQKGKQIQPVDECKVPNECDDLTKLYSPFKGVGKLALNGKVENINWLRDTGAVQTVALRELFNSNECDEAKEFVLLKGFGTSFAAPLINVNIETPLYTGLCQVAVVDEIPVESVNVILGNDICGEVVFGSNPIVTVEPSVDQNDIQIENVEIYPECAVTRSQTTKCASENEFCLGKLFDESKTACNLESVKVDKNEFIKAQMEDEQLIKMRDIALQNSIDVEKEKTCFFIQNGLLMRKYGDKRYDQVVVPEGYRKMLLEVAHANEMSGHFGINKTYEKLSRDYFWPKMKTSVKDFCNECEICQKVGKMQHSPRVVPLKPIVVNCEPFEELTLDCVGPLPKTKKGNEYLLTIMCNATRFPDAIPLRSINANRIVEVLQKFISYFGIPNKICTDQGSNFMSKRFKDFLSSLNIEHVTSTPYHPQTQGKLERFHGTFKTMIRSYCDNTNWDIFVPFLLFAIRDNVSSSTNYTPFQLVFTHEIRTPLKIIKEQLYEDKSRDLTLEEMKSNIRKSWDVAQKHLGEYQEKMKKSYDMNANAKDRSFEVGDDCLVYLPMAGKPLIDKYVGPCKVLEKISSENYRIKFPSGRRKEKVFHINKLKKFHKTGSTMINITTEEKDEKEEKLVEPRLQNSQYLENEDKLKTLYI